jgi:hypothetical protein
MIEKTWIAALLAALFLASTPAGGDKALTIPKATDIFAVSPSPSEDKLLLLSTRKQFTGDSDDVQIPAFLMSVAKAGSSWSIHEIKTAVSNLETGSIVWAKGSAYLSSFRGIFRLGPDGAVEKIYPGRAMGLAVSRDGAFLSFWNLAKHGFALNAFHIADRRVVKRWPRPYKLPTEPLGYEMAFTPDGGSILARTYDEPDGAYLKRFDLRSGAMTTLLSSCNSVVQSGDAIFVLGGEQQTKGLYRFSNGKLEFLTHIEEDDSLTPTAHSDLVAIINSVTEHVLIYDAANHTSQEVNGCADATVLKSGQRLFFSHGKIFLDPAECGGKDSR